MAREHMETRGSSMFTEISYDEKSKELIVDMVNYGRYSYRDFPLLMWQHFKKTASYGYFYNQYVKGVYQYTRLR
jgi:hypothetical protein